MNVRDYEEAVIVLNLLNDKGIVRLSKRTVGFTYILSIPDARNLSEVRGHADVGVAMMALSVLLGDRTLSCREGLAENGSKQWLVALEWNQARGLLEAGVSVPDKEAILRNLTTS